MFRRRPREQQRAAETVIPPRPMHFSSAGQSVDERSALGIAASWRSMNLIAGTIASLPMHTFEAGERIEDPPIVERPDPLSDRVDTISSAVVSLLLYGNFFAPLGGFDDLGYPSSLSPVHPASVLLKPVGGRWLCGVPGFPAPLEASEMAWAKGICLPGKPLGLGVIDACASTLGHSLALNAWSQSFFTEDPTPPGVIQVPEEMSAEEAAELQAGWIAAHSGSRAPAVLAGGATFNEYGLSAEAAQFIESRKFSAGEIASLYGVPAHFVGGRTDSLTYSTVEGDALAFVRWGLSPWIVRLERMFNGLLPPRQYVKINFDGLLRGTTRERYEAHKIALDAGWMSVDEVRALEDLRPMPVSAPVAPIAAPPVVAPAPPVVARAQDAPVHLRVVRDADGRISHVVADATAVTEEHEEPAHAAA